MAYSLQSPPNWGYCHPRTDSSKARNARPELPTASSFDAPKQHPLNAHVEPTLCISSSRMRCSFDPKSRTDRRPGDRVSEQVCSTGCKIQSQEMKRLTSYLCRRIGTWQNLGASPSRPAVSIHMVDIWTESDIRSPSCRVLGRWPSFEDGCEHLVHRVFPWTWVLGGLALSATRRARCC